MPSFGFCGHQAHLWCTVEDIKQQAKERRGASVNNSIVYQQKHCCWLFFDCILDRNLCSPIWNTYYLLSPGTTIYSYFTERERDRDRQGGGV